MTDIKENLVVVGLGYVGLPLVARACEAGLVVVGLDVSEDVVNDLNAGLSHVDDLANDDIQYMLDQGFVATTDAEVVREARDVVICVPTPLSPVGGPDLGAVVSACETIAPFVSEGTLVVLESTTYPGTTAEVVGPLLEEGSGMASDVEFFVAYSPERIDPGNPIYGLKNTPKIVGADSESARSRVVELYSRVVDEVVIARGTREAESAKLLENTYRHVNIALVNEMSKFFHELSIDFWDVLALAATKPFGFQRFDPGPGVGGHCIPIDPNYLSHRVKTKLGYSFRFVELAQEINFGMPAYVAGRAVRMLNSAGLPMRGARVLLVGVTYKADISDQRESPATALAAALSDLGANVLYSDPHVSTWPHAERVELEADVLASVDLAIVLQKHSRIDLDFVSSNCARLLDTRGAIPASDVVERL